MASSLIPRNAAARCDWFSNWKLEFTALAPGLGFTAAEIGAITNEADWAIFACLSASDAQSYAVAWATWRTQLLEDDSTDPVGPVPTTTMPSVTLGVMPMRGIIHRYLGYIRRVKASPGYTGAIGDQLRINPGASPAPDPATAKPLLAAAPQAMSRIRIDWQRSGSDGVDLQGQRDVETEWTSLGVKTSGTFTDARPPLLAGKPEVRRYRAIFIQGDLPVGLWSDVVTVVAAP